MSAKLEIAAGIEVRRSSSIMAAVYECISLRMLEGQAQRWLCDVSKRPAPFLDISLRGLPPDIRRDFVAALRLARVAEDRPQVKATMREIDEAVQRAESTDPSFTSRPISGSSEDLDQIWDDEKTRHNQSPDRTAPSVTPPAAQESRH